MGFLNNIFQGLGSMFGGAGSSIMSGLGSLGKMFGGGGQSGGVGNIAQSLMGGGGGGGQMQPSTSKVSGGSNQSGGNNFMQGLFPGGVGQGVAGMAIPAIGNMFAPKPKMPDLTQTQGYKNLANFKSGNTLSQGYKDSLYNQSNRAREQRKRELDQIYHSARPGTDYTTDTNYQRDIANLDRGFQDQLADDLSEAEFKSSGQEQDRLTQLAQLDEAQIMMETGLSFQEANDFKQMFGNIGNMFLTSATRNPNQFDLASFFRGK